MWLWLRSLRWWEKTTLAVLLALVLVCLAAWAYHAAGWRNFHHAQAQWRAAGAPDDPAELLATQPTIDRSATRAWTRWCEAAGQQSAFYDLQAEAQECIDALLTGRSPAVDLTTTFGQHRLQLEGGWHQLRRAGCDPTTSGLWSTRDEGVLLPDTPALNQMRVLMLYRTWQVGFQATADPDAIFEDLSIAVQRWRHPDTLLDSMTSIMVVALADQAHLLAARRGRLSPEAFAQWSEQTRDLLTDVPAVFRREHACLQMPFLSASAAGDLSYSRRVRLQGLDDRLLGLRYRLDDFLFAGHDAALMCKRLRTAEDWRPGRPAPATKPLGVRSALPSVHGNIYETAITAWENDARQRASRLAARLYLARSADMPLPVDDAAWSGRFAQDLQNAWDPRLRYERRPDGGFAIGIDPDGPLLFTDSARRYRDRWLIEVGPPLDETARLRNGGVLLRQRGH